MHSSLPRLVRVIPRSQLTSETVAAVRTLPAPRPYVRPPTLIEILMKRKEAAGDSYPSNIRIEPVITREAFRGVPHDLRKELKDLTKER